MGPWAWPSKLGITIFHIAIGWGSLWHLASVSQDRKPKVWAGGRVKVGTIPNFGCPITPHLNPNILSFKDKKLSVNFLVFLGCADHGWIANWTTNWSYRACPCGENEKTRPHVAPKHRLQQATHIQSMELISCFQPSLQLTWDWSPSNPIWEHQQPLTASGYMEWCALPSSPLVSRSGQAPHINHTPLDRPKRFTPEKNAKSFFLGPQPINMEKWMMLKSDSLVITPSNITNP